LRDHEATPFEQCAAHEMQAEVRRALFEIPALFRSAVILRDIEGFSYEEIAEVLDVSVGTVKSRILRGRRMLKKILSPVLRPSKSDPVLSIFSRSVVPSPLRSANVQSPAQAEELSNSTAAHGFQVTRRGGE
jgi:RNA polymerase sigma-70 factor (ECF subfamily)